MSAGRGAAGRQKLTRSNECSILEAYLQLNPDIDATASRANELTVADQVHERTVKHG